MFLNPFGPIAVALGLAAWPALVSVRVGRWGQALLLLIASGLASIAAAAISAAAMFSQVAGGLPIGVVMMVALLSWIAALVAPVLFGIALHFMGRFRPPTPLAMSQWRSPK